MTKLKKFAKGKIHEFSTFLSSLQLMFDQTFSNLIICLMISQKATKMHQGTSMLQWILGRFDFSQNSFEMRVAKKLVSQ